MLNSFEAFPKYFTFLYEMVLAFLYSLHRLSLFDDFQIKLFSKIT